MRYEGYNKKCRKFLPFVGVNFVHIAPPAAEEHCCIPRPTYDINLMF